MPTTSLQTKSESVVVGLHTFRECCVMASPLPRKESKMAKIDKADMSCARVKQYTASDVSKAERHNERKNETYV